MKTKHTAGLIAVDLATLVGATAIKAAAGTADIAAQIGTGHFFWLDVYGGDATAREPLLRALGLDDPTTGWLQRFGQACRMKIGEELRVVTWLVGSTGELLEGAFAVHAAIRRYCLDRRSAPTGRCPRPFHSAGGRSPQPL